MTIADFLTPEVIDKHLASLSKEQLIDLYKDHVPVDTELSRQDIMDVVRLGFFQQSVAKLSQQLRSGSGAGYLMAQSLKYDYKGEGIDNFLAGLRELAKKE